MPASRQADWRWPALTLLLFAGLIALNPIGYRGGGADDWQYLQAARCWAEHGPCLPRDHWWGRWPLVAPMGALIAMFGENRITVGLVPLLAALGNLLLVARLGNRLFGAPAGWLAAMLFASTPVVLAQALDPTIDNIELFFILAGAALLSEAECRAALWRFGGAGLAFGLAFQARETSIAALPAVGLFLLLRARPFWPAALAFAAGFLAPLAVELLVYGLLTGDPLFRRHLSLAHTSLPSSEIAGTSPRDALPFFRWQLIAGWRHETGIHLHPLIDGPLEVLLNPKGGWTWLAAALAFAAFRTRLPQAQRSRAAAMLAIAAAHALLLIFVFSIDPKPRMMLVPQVAAALVLGGTIALLPRLFQALLLLARIVALATAYLFESRVTAGEVAARAWLAEHPGQVETAEATRRRLALVAQVEALPLADGSRPYLLVRTNRPCASARLRDLMPGALTPVREQPLGTISPVSGKYRALCLYQYSSPQAARALAAVYESRSPFSDEERKSPR
ncbi:ArnT family glycosyltransferase [Sphingomonas astaxanthinifaciens]|uniref:Glycosyltransferase RgtA/B/C/D-like domain-containing protein n=1 Tax=Sphingomonas astaxanthinifaciens DSM 22298 TaxID=1123267 RepID=A0ABQ5Z3R6_9SPHN|nr:glycosyltransferase family 39 protein [Sphingomonas astaxanthinifaciens]GLR46635.1 hypothetical protein GCM10007925_03460 [Sphingomonas astaxanthinifaciens DSM 22298]